MHYPKNLTRCFEKNTLVLTNPLRNTHIQIKLNKQQFNACITNQRQGICI